ncbi:MAG: hypothetical protein DCF29_03770 [Alphaproteobacteria bacterium]|nr:MAG: hypothetical protein DCF29_03770 [Alphaproteobacteria bacterium]
MTEPLPSTPSQIEVVLHSPMGEVRVWIEPDAEGGTLRTSIRLDYVDGPEGALLHDALARVAAHLDQAVRRLAPGNGRVGNGASPVARWISERVDAGPGWRTAASDLYRDYLYWCDANGVRAVSQRSCGGDLSDRGYLTAGKSRHGLTYRGGLRIKPGPIAVASTELTERGVG